MEKLKNQIAKIQTYKLIYFVCLSTAIVSDTLTTQYVEAFGSVLVIIILFLTKNFNDIIKFKFSMPIALIFYGLYVYNRDISNVYVCIMYLILAGIDLYPKKVAETDFENK